jgi:hypothetical protein
MSARARYRPWYRTGWRLMSPGALREYERTEAAKPLGTCIGPMMLQTEPHACQWEVVREGPYGITVWCRLCWTLSPAVQTDDSYAFNGRDVAPPLIYRGEPQ